MSEYLISIIIPVYNAEKYLRQCLDSVIAQTFTNWECILIDDGSIDSSGAICDEYVRKDLRFRACHKNNGGVSSARNHGIQEANGDWIYFCDADDVMLSDGLDTLVGCISEDVDLINAGYSIINEDGSFNCAVPYNPTELIDREEMVKRLIYSKDFLYQGYLWNKLFRKELINKYKICFVTDIYFNEDRLFVIMFICKSKKLVNFSTKKVYQYIEHNNGAMATITKSFNPKFITDFEAVILIIRELKNARYSKNCVNMWKGSAIYSYDRIKRLVYKYQYPDCTFLNPLKKELISEIGVMYYVIYKVHQKLAKLKSQIIKK